MTKHILKHRTTIHEYKNQYYLSLKSLSMALKPLAAVKSVWFILEQSMTTGTLGPPCIRDIGVNFASILYLH